MAATAFMFSPSGKIFVSKGDADRDPVFTEGALEDVATFAMHPSAAVLSYGVSCFEGLKVFRQPDGGLAVFRPRMNAARMVLSADALAMPGVPVDVFIRGCELVARSCDAVVPAPGKGSLYLRPLQFGTEPILGVSSGSRFRFHIFGSPVGNYFAGDVKGIRLRVQDGARVAPGGLGYAKCSANYAATLRARRDVAAAGDHEALYLDAHTRSVVEETAGSNVFAVLKDGRVVTPALSGTILAGVTRDSLIAIAREDMGLTVEERPLPIAEILSDAVEFFVCGTAVVVGPVAQIHVDGRYHDIPKPVGPVAMELRNRLVDLQEGRAEDPRGWMHRIP